MLFGWVRFGWVRFVWDHHLSPIPHRYSLTSCPPGRSTLRRHKQRHVVVPLRDPWLPGPHRLPGHAQRVRVPPRLGADPPSHALAGAQRAHPLVRLDPARPRAKPLLVGPGGGGHGGDGRALQHGRRRYPAIRCLRGQSTDPSSDRACLLCDCC